jgi:hypothetical protein
LLRIENARGVWESPWTNPRIRVVHRSKNALQRSVCRMAQQSSSTFGLKTRGRQPSKVVTCAPASLGLEIIQVGPCILHAE